MNFFDSYRISCFLCLYVAARFCQCIYMFVCVALCLCLF